MTRNALKEYRRAVDSFKQGGLLDMTFRTSEIDALIAVAEAAQREQDWLQTHDWTYPLHMPALYEPLRAALVALDKDA
jgi:hypothetical protein